MKPLSLFGKNKLNLILLVFGICVFYTPPSDPDFGWHFKYGEYMVRNLAVLRTNTFSYMMSDFAWENSYILMQIYMYLSYTFLGVIGAGLLSAFLLVSILLIISNALPFKHPAKIFFNLFLLVLLSKFLPTVRPLLISTAAFTFLIYTLLYKKIYIFYLPILFLLWANSHADFVLGIAALGIYTVFRFMDMYLKKDFKFLFRDVVVPFICLLVTLVNFFGLDIWLRMFSEASPKALGQIHINEFHPVSSSNKFFFYPFVIQIALSIYCTFFTDFGLKIGMWFKVVFILFLLLSIKSAYFVRIFTIISVFPISHVFDKFFQYMSDFIGTSNSRRLMKVFRGAFSTVLLIAIMVLARNLYFSTDYRWAWRSNYPVGAVSYVKEKKLEGRMFNPYGWGGYLIWQLPEYQTFIDGRMPSWEYQGYSAFADYIDILCNEESSIETFNTLVRKYDIRWGLLPRNDPFLTKLMNENLAYEVYSDDVAVVFELTSTDSL